MKLAFDTIEESAGANPPYGHFYQYGLNLIPARINNYMLSQVCDEINFIPHFIMDVITYSSWD